MMMVVAAQIYSGPGVVRNTGNTITDLILTKTNELGTIIISILYLRKLRQERVSHLAKVRYPAVLVVEGFIPRSEFRFYALNH